MQNELDAKNYLLQIKNTQPIRFDKVVSMRDINPLKDNYFSVAVKIPFQRADQICQILQGDLCPGGLESLLFSGEPLF